MFKYEDYLNRLECILAVVKSQRFNTNESNLSLIQALYLESKLEPLWEDLRKETFKCPQCKGNTKVPLTAIEKGKTSIVNITCPTCDGRGEISKNTYTNYVFALDQWCKCKDTDSYYFEENNTHGWKCKKCGKITQIG